MKLLATILFAFIFLQLCSAATIQGELFEWETLQKIEHAIIDVNSVPPQRIVAESGSYGFTVPIGSYSIVAMQFINGELAKIAEETVIVESEGNFTLDLVLKQATAADVEEAQGKGFETELFENKSDEIGPIWLFGGLATAMIIAAYAYLKIKKPAPKKPPEKSYAGEKQLDKYAIEVLDVLQRSGNRLTQKELREKVQSIGEAKISLILSELETMGKIKKIKKGRGNIIVLKGQG